jgi:hypothetical protein
MRRGQDRTERRLLTSHLTPDRRYIRRDRREDPPVQPRPTAAELLAAVADVLERDVVPALAGPVQHRARVAASLVAIVERELRLGPAGDAGELGTIEAVLGHAVPGDGPHDRHDEGPDAGRARLAAARAELAAAIRSGSADDPAASGALWELLMASVRADLAICKPGHDAWEGE